MTLWIIIDPIEELELQESKLDFYYMKDAHRELSDNVKKGFVASENFIIEIVGTSAIGKTTFKNMLINWLYILDKVDVLDDNTKKKFEKVKKKFDRKGKLLKKEFNEIFSKYKSIRNNALLFDHDFYLEPDPRELKNRFRKLKKKLKNGKYEYLYLFFDEFEYYFSYRENLLKEGKISRENTLDYDLYDSLLDIIQDNDKLRLLVFIFTSVHFILGDRHDILMDEDIRRRFDIIMDYYKLHHFNEGFKLMIMPLYIGNAATVDKKNEEVLSAIFEKTVSQLHIDDERKKEIKRHFMELVKALFTRKIPIYYIKGIIYLLLTRKDFSDDERKRITQNDTAKAEFLAQLTKSRYRQHMKYLLAQLVEKVYGTTYNVLEKSPLWKFFKKVASGRVKEVKKGTKEYFIGETLKYKSMID